MAKILIPGVGEVDVNDRGQAVQQQAGSDAVMQALATIAQLLNIQLQVNLRLARGWNIEDVIEDLQLNVPPTPIKVRPLEEPSGATGESDERPRFSTRGRPERYPLNEDWPEELP